MLRRYRAGGIDPLRRADPHITRSSTIRTAAWSSTRPGETTVEGLFACRRDCGWNARAESDDGELAARVHASSAVAPVERCRGEDPRVGTIATDLQTVVEDAAAHLYVWALKDIPQDLRDALADAAAPRDAPRPAQRVLDTILKQRPRSPKSA